MAAKIYLLSRTACVMNQKNGNIKPSTIEELNKIMRYLTMSALINMY